MSVTKMLRRAAPLTSLLALGIALAGCQRQNQATGNDTAALPSLPATLPLAVGNATAPTPAPAASRLPDAPVIQTVRVADRSPGADYAYAGRRRGVRRRAGRCAARLRLRL